jgi:hypothetical protein
MLRSYARHDYFEVPKLLQLDPGNVVLDVGAGTGALGTLILQENPKARPVASIQLVPCRLDMSLFLVISRKSAFGAILKASCLRCRSFLHSVLIKKPCCLKVKVILLDFPQVLEQVGVTTNLSWHNMVQLWNAVGHVSCACQNVVHICLYIWVNYNDLTATSLESWLVRGIIPKWP